MDSVYVFIDSPIGDAGERLLQSLTCSTSGREQSSGLPLGSKDRVTAEMLYWFHATRRGSPQEYISVLRDGCKPPEIQTKTKQLELVLSIQDPKVYCYLGRTREQFGDFCVVLRGDDLPQGEMCPFDSGGLVKNSPPVSGWNADARATYLSCYSFPTTERHQRTGEYPGTASADVAEYLKGSRPKQLGPHEVWTKGPVANIWGLGADWRSWTWEGRWAQLPLKATVHAWSCTPALFTGILEQLEASSGPEDELHLKAYRAGGVSALIADLRSEQSNA